MMQDTEKDDMGNTEQVTVTMNPETLEWLQSQYVEATSNSQAVLMAISDARTFHKMTKQKDVFVTDK